MPSSGLPPAKFEYLQKLTSRIRWGAVSRSTVGRVSRPTPRRVYRVSDVINRALRPPVQSCDRGSYKKNMTTRRGRSPYSLAAARAKTEAAHAIHVYIIYIHAEADKSYIGNVCSGCIKRRVYDTSLRIHKSR